MTTFTASTVLTLSVALSILYLVSKWHLFKKMGEAGWKSLIPVYSEYLIYKHAWCGKAFFGSLLATAAGAAFSHLAVAGSHVNPVLAVLSVACCAAALYVDVKTLYRLAKSFGHGVGYTLGLMVAEPVFTMILGLGKSEYVGA